MISTNQMIDKLAGMVGTRDLSDWETTFVERLVERKDAGQVTKLTEKQLEVLERLHAKHFA
jgi:hypothetical protein